MRKGPETLQRRNAANPFERAFALLLVGLVRLYTYIVSVALSPFRCFHQTIDNTYTLVAAPHYNCYDEEWNKHRAAIAYAVMQAIGIPLLVGILLFKNRRNFESNTFRWRYGLLVSGYKVNFFWWELFLMLKKTLLVVMVDLTNNYDRFLRTFLVEIVLFISMLMELFCRPRESHQPSSYYGIP
jgi:hypothetical protein